MAPRPLRSQGRPSTRVIPANWETSHAPVADRAGTAVVALRRPGSGNAFNKTSGRTEFTKLEPYATGLPSRIQGLRETARGAPTVVAAENVRITDYLVTVPLAVVAATGDLVEITTCSDPMLPAGAMLKVVEITRGSLRFERDLFCTILDTTGGVS